MIYYETEAITQSYLQSKKKAQIDYLQQLKEENESLIKALQFYKKEVDVKGLSIQATNVKLKDALVDQRRLTCGLSYIPGSTTAKCATAKAIERS